MHFWRWVSLSEVWICQFPRGYFRDVGFFLSFSTQYLNRLSKKSRVGNLVNLAGKKKSTIQFYVKIRGYHVLRRISMFVKKRLLPTNKKSFPVVGFDNHFWGTKNSARIFDEKYRNSRLQTVCSSGPGGKNLSHERKGPWLFVGIYRGWYMLPSYI